MAQWPPAPAPSFALESSTVAVATNPAGPEARVYPFRCLDRCQPVFGAQALVGTSAHTLWLARLSRGETVLVAAGHAAPVTGLAAAPDMTAASVDAGGILRLWAAGDTVPRSSFQMGEACAGAVSSRTGLANASDTHSL
jgi:hypothetical protein